MSNQGDVGIEVNIEQGTALAHVSFEIDDFVGSGQLGAVYGGVAQTEPEASFDVVVKVPHSEDKFEETKTEFNILNNIAQTIPAGVSLPVPQVWLGTIGGNKLFDTQYASDANRPVVVMPYYGDEQLLTLMVRNLLDEGKVVDAEMFAVDAGLAFCHAMEALHKNGNACTDRKIKDFYATNDGIVIIDWNVLRADTIDLRVAEIGLFGYLWHELYLGSKGQVPYMPFKDSIWHATRHADDAILSRGVVSIGFRLLMARAVSFNAEAQVEPFTGLRMALEYWKQLLAGDRDITLENVQTAFSYFSAGDTNLNSEQSEAILKDLQWRLNPDFDIADRDEAVKEAHSTYLDESGGVREEIIQGFRIDPLGIEETVHERLAEATTQKNWVVSPHFSRWQKIIEIIRIANDADITRREREDIEKWLLEVGKILHINPISDEENTKELANALDYLRQIQALIGDQPQLQLIRDEIYIRQNAEAYQSSYTLAQRKQILRDMQLDLSNLDEHYLDGPTGVSTSGATTLLDLILGQKILRDLDDRLEAIWSSKTLLDEQRALSADAEDATSQDLAQHQGISHAIYELYQTALSMVQLDDERQWIANTLQGDLEVARILRAFAVPRLALVQAAVSRIQSVLHAGYDLNENAVNILQQLLQEYSDMVIEALGTAVTDGHQSVDKIKPLYMTFIVDKRWIASRTPDQSATIREYTKTYNFYAKWFKAVDSFIDVQRAGNDTTQTIDTIIGLIREGEEMGGTVSREDLLGYEQLKAYRHTLEEALDSRVKNKVQELQSSITELMNELEKAGEESTQQLSALQETLARASATLDERKNELEGQIEALSSPLVYAKLYEYLSQFDLDNLRLAVKESDSAIPADIRSGLSDLSQLKDNEARIKPILDRAMPNLEGSSLLAQLKNLQNRLERNTLPDTQFAGADSFFTHDDIHALAQENTLLRRIVDLYWIVKVDKLRQTNAGSFTEVLRGANTNFNQMMLELAEAEKDVHAGDYGAAKSHLKQVTAYNRELRDQSVQQMVQEWHIRIASQEQFLNSTQQISEALIQAEIADKKQVRGYLKMAVELFEALVLEMKQCPIEAYSPNVNTKWQKQINDAYNDLANKLAKFENTISQIKKFEKYVKDSKVTAVNRAEEYTSIYPNYDGATSQ